MGRLGEGNHSAVFNQRRQLVNRKTPPIHNRHVTLKKWFIANSTLIKPRTEVYIHHFIIKCYMRDQVTSLLRLTHSILTYIL